MHPAFTRQTSGKQAAQAVHWFYSTLLYIICQGYICAKAKTKRQSEVRANQSCERKQKKKKANIYSTTTIAKLENKHRLIYFIFTYTIIVHYRYIRAENKNIKIRNLNHKRAKIIANDSLG